MKKQLLSIIMSAAVLTVWAQPTTHSVLPSIGTNYSFNTITGNVTHQAGGAGQNWNFNPLANSITLTYSVIPQSALTSSDVSTFPTTNYHVQSFLGGNPLGADFFELQATKLLNLGSRGSGGNYNINSTPFVEFNYGMGINSSLTFTYSGGSFTRTVKCDGTGTITTPYHSSNNALRLKVYETGNPDTLYTYYETQPEMKKLLQYVHKQNGTTANKFMYNWNYAPTLIKENGEMKIDFAIFPVPASDEIMISTEYKISELLIYDLHMKEVIRTYSSANKLNISELPASVYFLQVKTDRGSAISKFVKQ